MGVRHVMPSTCICCLQGGYGVCSVQVYSTLIHVLTWPRNTIQLQYIICWPRGEKGEPPILYLQCGRETNSVSLCCACSIDWYKYYYKFICFCPLWRGCPLLGGSQCIESIRKYFGTLSSVPCREVSLYGVFILEGDRGSLTGSFTVYIYTRTL